MTPKTLFDKVWARHVVTPETAELYDVSRSKYVPISGQVDSKKVNIYDHERSCHITSNADMLYDHGNGKYISYKLTDNIFEGYDYDTSTHYSGMIKGNEISIYDLRERAYFLYQCNYDS